MNERHEPLTERVSQRTLVAILGALIALVFVGGGVAVIADDEPLPAAGARLRLDGSGTLVQADGSEGPLRDGAVLHPGDQVEMEDGVAVLELAGGGTIEVRAGRGDVDDSRLEVGSPSRLLAGDALAIGPTGVAIEAAGTLVTLRGADSTAARIRRELAVTTATYRGTVALLSAERSRTVPAYRQLSVASVGRTPEEPDPFAIDAGDPWDQRFFGSVIALTRSLDSLSRTFTAQGTPRTTAADFAALLPQLAAEARFDSSLLDDARPDGETLVGAAIATLADEGSFDERWDEVFAFRDDGAEWGLVALDQGVDERPVLDEVEAALSRSVGQTVTDVATPVATTPTTTPATTSTTGTTSTTTTPTTSGGSTTTAPPTTPTTPPVTVPPAVPPLTLPPLTPQEPIPDTGDTLLDGLLGPVGDLLGGLLGG